MLPLRNTASTVCLSQTNFIALISTAVVITAAATFWCTRRLRTCAVKPHRPQLATPKAAPVAALATNSPSSPSTNNYNPAAAVTSDDCSYLCSSCGTEKYSADQLAASQNFSSKSSPYKMVILVRTDLNMVQKFHFMTVKFYFYRVKVKRLLSAVMPSWLLTRQLLRNPLTPSSDGNAKVNPK